MITIVIADDEKLIRAGIKKILSEALGPDIRFLEAKNGKEAMDLCIAEQPYVVITDIKMPKMDGVEFMERLSQLDEKPAIIVLSGFDDFTYAKAAIKNKTLAYILKPVDNAELIEAVNSALSSVKKEEREKTEERLKSIITHGYAGGTEFYFKARDFENEFFCVTISGRMDCEESELFPEIAPLYVVNKKKNLSTVLLPQSALEKTRQNSALKNFAAGISPCSTSVNDLRKLCNQSYAAAMQSFFASDDYMNSKRACGIYEFSAELSNAELLDLDGRYNHFVASIDLMNDADIRKNVELLLDFSSVENSRRGAALCHIQRKIVNDLFTRYPKYNEANPYLYVKALMIENLDQAESLGEWRRFIKEYSLYLTELLLHQSGKYPQINRALEFIAEHYNEDITMATVANHVSMNYTWFSERFRDQVGVNFNEYLKKFRMEQAKKLLQKGVYKVYEVAAKCGFNDVKHFMKSFREMNGMSAGEWARTHAEAD